MKPLLLIIYLILSSTSSFAQTPIGRWMELGLDISFNPAIGFSIGRVDYEKPLAKINYIGVYWLGFDGLLGKGKYYDDVISFDDFPQDIKKEGYGYNHFGVRVGMSTETQFLPYAILGIKAVSLVQNRYDRFRILGESGEYHIRRFEPNKTEMDIGVGFRLTPAGNYQGKYILGIEASRQRRLSFVLNYSFRLS